MCAQSRIPDPPGPMKAEDEPPPLFGTWRRIYLAVVIYVLILVLVLYWMTVALND